MLKNRNYGSTLQERDKKDDDGDSDLTYSVKGFRNVLHAQLCLLLESNNFLNNTYLLLGRQLCDGFDNNMYCAETLLNLSKVFVASRKNVGIWSEKLMQ